MKYLTILCLSFTVLGCSHNLVVPGTYGRNNPASVSADARVQKVTRLVLLNSFKTYTFEKKAYNWAGGSLFPDTLTFELGRALSEELSALTQSTYVSASEAPDLQSAIASEMGNSGLVIVPEIERVSLDLPPFRFADIEAAVALRYSLYDGNGRFITSSSLEGKAKKVLGFTKQNYVIAFQEAIKDLMLKTSSLFRGIPQ